MFATKNKDEAFFEAFASHAVTSVEAAKLLVAMLRLVRVETPPGPYEAASNLGEERLLEEVRRLAANVKEAETRGDHITHRTIKSLRENWITPLDRRDIHVLISHLDDVLDLIEEASERMVLYEVRRAPPEAVLLAEALLRTCETMAEAVALLTSMKNASKILELCVEVNRRESEADAIYRKALAEMFRPGGDPLLVMKWRDIFDRLEAATDRCEDVANVVEGVVLEYA